MKSAQDRYFYCLESCHHHEQIETPKRICLAALTDDPYDNPKVSIDQTWFTKNRRYGFEFNSSNWRLFGRGTLSKEEVDFLERAH